MLVSLPDDPRPMSFGKEGTSAPLWYDFLKREMCLEETYISDIRHTQNSAHEWQLSQERQDYREEIPTVSQSFSQHFTIHHSHNQIKKRAVKNEKKKKRITHPNRFKNPNVSIMTPMKGHLRKTRRIPPMKQTVPRSFCFRAKK